MENKNLYKQYIFKFLFLLIFLFNLIISYSQSCHDVKELLRKRHTISGMTYGHPYTMFDRHNKLSFDSIISNIRRRITNEYNPKRDSAGTVYLAYKAIYDNATKLRPTDNGIKNGDAYSALAYWAKNNAFVFLIGLDGNGAKLDTIKYDGINYSDSARNAFRDRAKNAFNYLTDKVEPHAALLISVYNSDDTNLQHYSRSLIYWLQAYDLLKAAYEVTELREDSTRNPWGFGDADRNTDGDCGIRRKLRDYARNLYTRSEGIDGIVEHAVGWKKNHGIACASALLMAAQVLNDAGTETNFFVGIWGSIKNWFGSEEVEYAPKYSPVKWNELAQSGLYDNLFVGKHWNFFGLLADDVPQAYPSKIKIGSIMKKIPFTINENPYAEGPGYASYGLFDCGIPAMVAQKNLYPDWSDEPFIKDPAILAIFDWYYRLQTDENMQPSYDNSEIKANSILGITGIGKYNKGIDGLGENLLADYVAIVGGNNIVLNKELRAEFDVMEYSGNIVIRNRTDSASHTFHMLYETDLAVDKAATLFDDNHEDSDMGSFLFYASDKDKSIPLAIDPPYTGWQPHKGANTNKYWMHNTIEIDDGNPAKDRVYKNPKYSLIDEGKFTNIQRFDLTFDFKNEDHQLFGSAITRSVNAIKNSENFYYFINDYVDAYLVKYMDDVDGDFQYVKLNLNGNGNKDLDDESSTSTPKLKSYRKEGNLHRWTYPCKNDKWGLTAHIAALGNNEEPYWEATPSNDANNVSEGTLTHLQVHQKLSKTIFQSFLYPQKCNWDLPVVTKEETADHVTTKIRFINGVDTSILAKFGKSNFPKYINDTASHFHFARWQGCIADTVTNPFNLPTQSNIKLYLNAQKAFIKHNTYAKNIQGYKYCPASYINIKYASIDNGSYLKFNDTFLIKSPILMNAYLGFQSRYSYIANITPLATNTTVDSIEIYLADVGRGKDMVALSVGTYDTLPSRYDSLTRVLYMAVPTKAVSFFITEKQNCVNCYFPPTWMNIVDTFEADDKLTHVLGNKLTIKQPNGLLQITNSTKIKMCEGVYLRNKNLLIIEGPCQSKAYEHKTCKGIDSMVAAFSDNSSLTINNNSALVLELGSQTYVRNGGAIYVKQGGSLIVKAGAYLEIGDSGTCNRGWGEIIAEPGAYIHIEPGAQISYRSTIGDTTDRNMFIIPTASGLPKAFEGVGYLIKTILYQDTVLPLTFPTYPICGLDSTSPIINKPWGYTNFAKPLATFQAKNDTLCPNEPLYIKLNRILNDARTTIEVCRVDSFKVFNRDSSVFRWQDTCIIDTLIKDSILPDPVCKEPRTAPDDLTFWFKAGTTHRVTIRVWNDCGIMDDTISYIYAMDTPQISISMPTEICEGIGTASVSITKLNKYPVSSYAFEVTEIPDSALSTVRKGVTQSFSRTYYDTLPNAYNFEDYYFKTGRKYAITLLVNSVCGSKTFNTEVTVPLAAKIVASRPVIYERKIGNENTIQLNGIINGADSFRWSPSNGISRTDSLVIICNTNSNTTYYLTAYKNGCTATDSILIRYNTLSYIGNNDTLCTADNMVLLGNKYNAPLFLGWLNKYNGINLKSILLNKFNDEYKVNYYDSNYLKYFNAFMFTSSFADVTQRSGCYPIYNIFTSDTIFSWEQIFRHPNFKNYYYDYVNNSNWDYNALDGFNTFIESTDFNPTFAENSIDESNTSCIVQLVEDYQTYYTHVFNNDAPYTPPAIYWYKIVGNDTTEMTKWRGQFLALDSPTVTTTYIQQIFHTNNSAIDIDIKTVHIDSVITPLFYPALQFDSTIYFMNNTQPMSSATNYEWNFGDGSAISNELNPIHTFPAFDSNYVVCLTASNKCNSWQYCDTVWVDSLHLGGTLKTANKPAFFETNQQATEKINVRSALGIKPEARSQQLVSLQNYPNPFNQSTIIDYQIWQSFNQAELRITNILGQVLLSQKLQKPIDKVEIDGSNLANGLYYYSIVVDNSVKLTKTMSVIH